MPDLSQQSLLPNMNDYNDNCKEKGYRHQDKYNGCGEDTEHGGELSSHGARYGMLRKSSLALEVSMHQLKSRYHN
jgi:hypothetical protein